LSIEELQQKKKKKRRDDALREKVVAMICSKQSRVICRRNNMAKQRRMSKGSISLSLNIFSLVCILLAARISAETDGEETTAPPEVHFYFNDSISNDTMLQAPPTLPAPYQTEQPTSYLAEINTDHASPIPTDSDSSLSSSTPTGQPAYQTMWRDDFPANYQVTPASTPVQTTEKSTSPASTPCFGALLSVERRYQLFFDEFETSVVSNVFLEKAVLFSYNINSQKFDCSPKIVSVTMEGSFSVYTERIEFLIESQQFTAANNIFLDPPIRAQFIDSMNEFFDDYDFSVRVMGVQEELLSGMPPLQTDPTERPTAMPTAGVNAGDPTPSPSDSIFTFIPAPVPTSLWRNAPDTSVPTKELMTNQPTDAATTDAPTEALTNKPSREPTPKPTREPTEPPFASDLDETLVYTLNPSALPKTFLTSTPAPADNITQQYQPTPAPSTPLSSHPSATPSLEQSTSYPTFSPSTISPTFSPSTRTPTASPTRRPTSSPSRNPSSNPTVSPLPSLSPTQTPSASPSSRPSLAPTATPEYVLTESELVNARMILTGVSLLSTRSQRIFTRTFEILVRDEAVTILNKVETVDVRVFIQSQIPQLSSLRRNLEDSPNSTGPLIASNLTVVFGVRFFIRAVLEEHNVRRYVGATLDTAEDQEMFILQLKSSGESAFQNLSYAHLVLPPEESTIEPSQENFDPETLGVGISIGIATIAVGGAALIGVAFYMWGRRKPRKTRRQKGPEQAVDDSRSGEEEDNDDMMVLNVTERPDVSTLGDPYCISGPTDASLGEETNSLPYDYKVAAEVLPSIGGVSASYSFSSEMSSNNVYLQTDDETLGAQYEIEDRVEVEAPPGMLGLVLESDSEGFVTVCDVKERSPLADRIIFGDKLVAVDDVDVTVMPVGSVMHLIASRQANPVRKLTFNRRSKRKHRSSA